MASSLALLPCPDFSGNSRTATPRPADKLVERLSWTIQLASVNSLSMFSRARSSGVIGIRRQTRFRLNNGGRRIIAYRLSLGGPSDFCPIFRKFVGTGECVRVTADVRRLDADSFRGYRLLSRFDIVVSPFAITCRVMIPTSRLPRSMSEMCPRLIREA